MGMSCSRGWNQWTLKGSAWSIQSVSCSQKSPQAASSSNWDYQFFQAISEVHRVEPIMVYKCVGGSRLWGTSECGEAKGLNIWLLQSILSCRLLGHSPSLLALWHDFIMSVGIPSWKTLAVRQAVHQRLSFYYYLGGAFKWLFNFKLILHTLACWYPIVSTICLHHSGRYFTIHTQYPVFK